MKNTNTKVKLIILLAITLIIALFSISIIQIVSIYNKNKILTEQQRQINDLNNQLDYYKNQENDNKDSDVGIIPEA